MRLRLLTVVVAFLPPAPAMAEMVTFHYSGTLRGAYSTNATINSLPFGTPVSGTITYDAAAPSLPVPVGDPHSTFTTHAIYKPAGSYTLTVAGLTFTGGGASGLEVTLSSFVSPYPPLPNMDFLTFEADEIHAPDAVTGGSAPRRGLYTYFGLTNLRVESDGSPEAPRTLPADLTTWPFTEGTVLFGFDWYDPTAPHNYGFVNLEAFVTSIEAAPLTAPEPTALLLAGVGVTLALTRGGCRAFRRRLRGREVA